MASINRLSPLLALAVGVAHAGLSSVLAVGGVRPNVLVIAVVLVAAWGRPVPAMLWAYLAGLTANLVSSDPLGAVPLVVVIVAALASAAAPRDHPPLAVASYVATASGLGSVLADVMLLALRALVDAEPWYLPQVELLAGSAAVNAALAGAAAFAVSWPRRRARSVLVR